MVSAMPRPRGLYCWRLLPEPSLALLVGANRAQEVDLAEGRPEDVGEIVLAEGALPQNEPDGLSVEITRGSYYSVSTLLPVTNSR